MNKKSALLPVIPLLLNLCSFSSYAAGTDPESAPPPSSAAQFTINAFCEDTSWIPQNCSSYYYTFIDLDFDGSLEMIAGTYKKTENEMTSQYKIFKADPEKSEIICLENTFSDSESYDVFEPDNISLYFTNEGGTYFSSDTFIKNSRETLVTSGEIVISENKASQKDKFGALSYSQGKAIKTTFYNISDSKNFSTISEDDYNSLLSQNYSKNNKMKLSYKIQPMTDYDKMNQESIKSELEYVYESFEYRKQLRELDLGDVNGDDTVDPKDATEILIDYANTILGSSSRLSYETADANDDGIIDSKDASTILLYSADKILDPDIGSFYIYLNKRHTPSSAAENISPSLPEIPTETSQELTSENDTVAQLPVHEKQQKIC